MLQAHFSPVQIDATREEYKGPLLVVQIEGGEADDPDWKKSMRVDRATIMILEDPKKYEQYRYIPRFRMDIITRNKVLRLFGLPEIVVPLEEWKFG